MKYTKTVRASKKVAPSARRPIRANRRVVKADEDIEPMDDEIIDEDIVEEEPMTEEILFEADDVAEVLAEVTGEPVDYTVDDETTEVTFTVGDDEFTITPDGDEEVVEDSTRISRTAKRIAASRRLRASRRMRK